MQHSGIIKVISTNGNGFYPPFDDATRSLLDVENFIPKPVLFPIDFVILGYQDTENKVYKQIVTIHNRKQFELFKETATKYGSIAPLAMLNKKGRKLHEDMILDSMKMDEMFKL